MIKYCLVDFDNTLLDFDGAVYEILKEIFEERNRVFDKKTYDTFLEINNRFWTSHEKGEISVQYIKENRFKEFFKSMELPQTNILETEQKFRNGISNSCIKIKNADKALLYLKSKYKIYIASNGVASTQYKRIKTAGWDKIFDNIFLSEEIGCQKPCKEFFYKCMDIAGSNNAEEYIMIGDNLNSDIKGGHSVGMKTCWYNRHNAPVPDDFSIDYVINDMDNLQNIL